MERKVRMAGNPLTLAGREVAPGENAPNFSAVSPALSTVRLSDFRDRIKVVTFFPSLDTSVCSDQVKEFNRRAAAVSADVTVIGISMDLPFAQERFCKANAITDMVVLSDHRFASFGSTYGLLLEGLRLLARGALVIDKRDILRFSHLVDELTSPVDFDLVMARLAEVAARPYGEQPAFPWRCIPCEEPSASMEPGRLDMLLAQRNHWRRHGGGITKEFSFRDFSAAMRFAGIVAEVSAEEGYNPSLSVSGNSLTVGLRSDGTLTANEIVMARVIDEIRY